VGGIWFVVSAQGKLVRAAASASMPGSSNGSSGASGGGYGSSGYADPYGG